MKKLSTVLSSLILLFGAALVAVFAIPLLKIPGTYQVVMVRSGSMEPTIKTGALAFFKPAENYEKDDVLAFQIDLDDNSKYIVIHRAIEKKTTEDGKTVFVTKGDANQDKDSRETPAENVLGKVFFNIPYVGYVVSWIQTTTGKVALIVIPIVLLLYHEVQSQMAKRATKKQAKESKEEHKEDKKE